MATIATKALTIKSARQYPNTAGMVEILLTGSPDGMIFNPDNGALTFPTEEMLQFLWRWAKANNITFAQAAGKVITFTVTVV